METASLPRLSKAEILAADDIEELDVAVPQWGGTVRIRAFTMQQVADCTQRATRRDPRTGKDEQDQNLMIGLLLTEGVIDPKFTIAEATVLLGKSARAVNTIIKAINDLSGLSEAAVADADKSIGPGFVDAVSVSPGAGTEDDARGATPANDHERVRALDRAVQP